MALSPNALKTSPTDHMGTRDMVFFVVDLTGVATDYADANSLYHKAVSGLQTTVELYAVGMPYNDRFLAIASGNTAPFADGQYQGDGQDNLILAAAVTAATGESCNVWNALLEGDNFSYD